MRFDDIISLFSTIDTVEIWEYHVLDEAIIHCSTLKRCADEVESYGYRTVHAIEPRGTTRIRVILNEEK